MERPWLQHYEPKVPKSLKIPDRTIPDLLADAIVRYPKADALVYFSRRLSFTDLGKMVERFAAVLSQLGVRKGDRVAIILPNMPQYPIAHYAIMKLGAIAVPTNPLYVERELEHQLSDSGAKVAVALDLICKRLEAVRPHTALEQVIYASVPDYMPLVLRALYPIKAKRAGKWVKAPRSANTHGFKDLMQRDFPPPPAIAISPDDLAIFLYTGGTTGVSKGAVLTHRNLVANVLQICSWIGEVNYGRETILAALPFFHSYGMTTCLHLSVYIGSRNILLPRFDIHLVLKWIQKYRVSMFPGVPTMYVAVNNSPLTPKYNLKAVKVCLSGGAPLPLEVAKTFAKITGGASLVEGYGLSEASPVTHCNPLFSPSREGAIGLPVPETDAAVVDPENRHPLPPGAVGELAVRGPQVMQGYWRMEQETRQVLHDGWLLTGDMARMDKDGYFYIVDRKKDMIISGGLNIYPREVEEVLFSHPKIQEAAVIGTIDPYRGEVVKAFVVLKENVKATEEEIIAYCRERLAPYKVPKLLEFRPELPKSLIGKVLRRVLAEEEKRQRVATGTGVPVAEIAEKEAQ